MIISITGTPGTGKTSVAVILKSKGFEVIDLNKEADDNNFLTGKDKIRDSYIVDIEKFNNYIFEKYRDNEIVFIEGHLSHLLKNADKIIILRCYPKILKKNLLKKGWKKEKIKENLEAEILDVILCETYEIHKEDNIFEINTSDKTIEEISDIIIELSKNKFKSNKKYRIGKIDWSEEILNNFKAG
jgi:adenylate kinase